MKSRTGFCSLLIMGVLGYYIATFRLPSILEFLSMAFGTAIGTVLFIKRSNSQNSQTQNYQTQNYPSQNIPFTQRIFLSDFSKKIIANLIVIGLLLIPVGLGYKTFNSGRFYEIRENQYGFSRDHIGDFDNDGKNDDKVQLYGTSVIISYNFMELNPKNTAIVALGINDYQNLFVGDFNGDGLDDVLINDNIYPPITGVILFGAENGNLAYLNRFELNDTTFSNCFVFSVGYLNDDDYSDLIVKYNGILFIGLNNGILGKNVTFSWINLNYPHVYKAIPIDYNHDQLQDILVSDINNEGNFKIKILVPSEYLGFSIQKEYNTSIEIDGYDFDFTYGDFLHEASKEIIVIYRESGGQYPYLEIYQKSSITIGLFSSVSKEILGCSVNNIDLYTGSSETLLLGTNENNLFIYHNEFVLNSYSIRMILVQISFSLVGLILFGILITFLVRKLIFEEDINIKIISKWGSMSYIPLVILAVFGIILIVVSFQLSNISTIILMNWTNEIGNWLIFSILAIFYLWMGYETRKYNPYMNNSTKRYLNANLEEEKPPQFETWKFDPKTTIPNATTNKPLEITKLCPFCGTKNVQNSNTCKLCNAELK